MATNLLFIIHGPITENTERQSEIYKEQPVNEHLIIVTSPQINHDVLVPRVRGRQTRMNKMSV